MQTYYHKLFTGRTKLSCRIIRQFYAFDLYPTVDSFAGRCMQFASDGQVRFGAFYLSDLKSYVR